MAQTPSARWLLRRLRALSVRRILLLAEGSAWLVAAKVALRIIPVRYILAWKQRAVANSPARDQAAIADITWAIAAIARRSPVDFVCFPQSLAAHAMLAARGIPTRLHYGAARINGRLEAHAWLEAGGRIVTGEDESRRFTALQIF